MISQANLIIATTVLLTTVHAHTHHAHTANPSPTDLPLTSTAIDPTTPCPTITTLTPCPTLTCPILDCLKLSTLTQPCSCPPVPTTTVTFGCETDASCEDILSQAGVYCAGTSWKVVTGCTGMGSSDSEDPATTPTDSEDPVMTPTDSEDPATTPTDTETDNGEERPLSTDGAVTVNAAAGKFRPFFMWQIELR